MFTSIKTISTRWALILCLFPLLSTAQIKWDTLYTDDQVSFHIPSNYQLIDTLNQRIFFSQSDLATFQVAKIFQPELKVHNHKSLIDQYNQYQHLSIKQSNGTLISDSTLKLNELSNRFFQFENYNNDELTIHESRIVLINQYMYSFTYSYLKENETTTTKEKNRFFSSILTNTGFESQMIPPTKTNELDETAYYAGYILRYIIIAAAIITFILWLLKKHELVKKILNTFSMAFLTFGAVSLSFFITNLFFGNRTMSFLIGGSILLLMGFVLRRIKVP